jgi:two-component system, LytTR family, sensor kinase
MKEKLSTELQMLKSQLNPHFLFNTLNNIYGLTRKKSDMAPEAVLKLSEMLSFMLYEANSGTISIRKEIQFLEDYISLQRLRYPDSFRIVFNKVVDDEAQQIAPLLLLPLLENAFKHGAGDSHADSYIHIDLKLQQAQLMFTITNSFERNGPDMRSDTIGLHNIKRQLQLLYRTQQLVLMDNDNVFTAQLSINLDSYEKI